MKTPASVTLFVLVCVSSLITFAATPGDLDLGFFGIGSRHDEFVVGGSEHAFAIAVQTDGKIVAAGDAGLGSAATCGISRFTQDGDLDSTFDGDGRLVFVVGRPFVCSGLAIQTDGKIVVAGYIDQFGTDVFAVARLNIDGSLDTTFSSDGMVLTTVGSSDARIYAVVIQTDGNIVVGGSSHSGSSVTNFTAARYTTSGLLDPTFDGDGIAVLDVSPLEDDDIYALAIQPDAKIVAAGRMFTDPFTLLQRFAVARFNQNGTPDTSFDADGFVVTPVQGGTDLAFAVAIQPDGKIVAAGTSYGPAQTQFEFALARYNTDGSLDTSFDSDGLVVTSTNNSAEFAYAVAIHPDGKITAGGYIEGVAGGPDIMLTRYNANGSLDGSFDQDGRVVTDLPGASSNVKAILLRPDGKTIAAGYVNNGIEGHDMAVLRYKVDGSLDTSFSDNGVANVNVGYRMSSANAVAIQSDKKLVVGGYTDNAGGDDFALARYNANGILDTSFGTDGHVVTGVLPDFSRDEAILSLAIQGDGKIVAVGTVRDSPTDSIRDGAVVRYHSNGSLDTSFDGDGKVTFSFGLTNYASAVVIQPDGKILIAGASSQPDYAMMLVRLNPDGSFDNTFDTDGRAFISTPADDYLIAVGLQPDGKIVAAGYISGGPTVDFAVVRFNSNGTPDASFDADGMVVTPVLDGDDLATAMAIQPDGKIVVSGYSYIGTNIDFATVRYNTDGSLDPLFHFDGKVTTPVLSGTDQASSVAIQGNGKIVVGGTSRDSILRNEFAIVRYHPDGQLDSSFGNLGKRTVDLLAGSNDSLAGMAIDSNGRIVAVGSMNGNFAIARFHGDFIPDTSTPFDFDGDRKTDIGIFRPGVAEWWIQNSGDGNILAAQFGATTDKIVPADYTGDGKSDIAVWRPASGEWYVLRSEDFSFYAFPFGTNGDVPVPSDFDADGKSDAAVFRPSSATWFIRRSTDQGTTIEAFGANGDIAVPSDYDGDGKADIAIFRPSLGQWWLNRSTAGLIALTFGDAADKPVQGDYTGDGKSDIAFWRPSTGVWYVLRSEDFSFFAFPFGTTGDIPAPGDYDGDGKYDATVFRPSSATWYSQRTTAGTLIRQFGASGDRPLANAFVP